jgi:hypothetical protein
MREIAFNYFPVGIGNSHYIVVFRGLDGQAHPLACIEGGGKSLNRRALVDVWCDMVLASFEAESDWGGGWFGDLTDEKKLAMFKQMLPRVWTINPVDNRLTRVSDLD